MSEYTFTALDVAKRLCEDREFLVELLRLIDSLGILIKHQNQKVN